MRVIPSLRPAFPVLLLLGLLSGRLPACTGHPALTHATKKQAAPKGVHARPLERGKAASPGKRPGTPGSVVSAQDSDPVPVPPKLRRIPLILQQQAALDSDTGLEAFARGDLPTAEFYLRRSTDVEIEDSRALAALAQTLEREGKGREAIDVYRYLLYPKAGWGTSLEEDPLLRMRYALLLDADGQWPEAASVYEKTMLYVTIGTNYPSLDARFSPDVPQPVLLQAMAHLVMGVVHSVNLEHDKALPEYAAAIEAQPNLGLAYYCYGFGLQRMGRRAEAAPYFGKAAALGTGEVRKAAQRELPAAVPSPSPRPTAHPSASRLPRPRLMSRSRPSPGGTSQKGLCNLRVTVRPTVSTEISAVQVTAPME